MSEVQYQWGETHGKKYKRGSRLPKAENPAPAAKTPDVPWTWEEDGMTVIRGTARSAPGCHNVCGILSYVKDGKLVKVEGDPEDPYNQGRLCSRCLCIPDYVYSPERLQYPMKRAREDRGKDKFERITWDEAYDIIVENFKRIADTWGVDKIACCQGTGRDIHQVTRVNASMVRRTRASRTSPATLAICPASPRWLACLVIRALWTARSSWSTVTTTRAMSFPSIASSGAISPSTPTPTASMVTGSPTS